MTKRLDDIIKRLERIEFKLDDYQQRIAKLEERTSILHH
jgi:tetrahydromethanopterin S-methyltransferase subunit G